MLTLEATSTSPALGEIMSTNLHMALCEHRVDGSSDLTGTRKPKAVYSAPFTTDSA